MRGYQQSERGLFVVMNLQIIITQICNSTQFDRASLLISAHCLAARSATPLCSAAVFREPI